MTVSEDTFNTLLVEWMEAKTECDRLIAAYDQKKQLDSPKMVAAKREGFIDLESLYPIAKAKQKEEQCMEALYAAARERVGAAS